MSRCIDRNTVAILPAVLGFLQFIIQPAQERGTLDTTGTVSFVAVIFEASLKFLRANFTKLGKLITRMVLRAKQGSLGLSLILTCRQLDGRRNPFVVFSCFRWSGR